MVMPNVYPALALAPQTANLIASAPESWMRSYQLGREERLDDERRNYLREAGNLASQGNISGAVGAAFRGGDPTTAMNISNWDTSRRVQALNMLREGAQRADTPERWSAFVGSVERVFGPDMVGQYRDFNSRPAAFTALEQAQLQLSQAHAQLYGAQAGAVGRQVENQRASINLLTRPPGAGEVAPPLPVSPPSAAPPVAATAPTAPTPAITPPQAPNVSPPPPRPSAPVTAPATQPPAPAVAPPSPPASVPPSAPASPSQPTPPAAAPPRGRRELWQMFESINEAQKAEVLALIRENKIDDAFKKLGEYDAGGAPLTVQQRGQAEEGLRREFSTLAKPYFEVRDAYSRIEQVSRNPSAAGDLALIFNFMKMLDPGSTVREGEFATAQNTAGIPERIRAYYNRIMSGERLTDTQRNDFVSQSRNLMTVQERQYQAIQGQYLDIAQRGGLDPRNVFVDFSRPPTPHAEATRLLTEARDAIASGRDPQAIMSRLHQMGVDPSQLGMVPYSRTDQSRPNFYGNY